MHGINLLVGHLIRDAVKLILSPPRHFGFLEHFLGSVLEQFLVHLRMGVFPQGIGLPSCSTPFCVGLPLPCLPQHILGFYDTFWNGHFRAGFYRWDTLSGLVFWFTVPMFVVCHSLSWIITITCRNVTKWYWTWWHWINAIDVFDDEEDAFNFLDC